MSTVYLNAAASLTSFLNKEGGLKGLLFSPSSWSSGSSSTAQRLKLVAETLRYKEVLDSIIDECQLMRQRPPLSRSLVLVALYDLLFGAGSITGGGHVKRVLLAQRTPIQAALARTYIRKGVSTPLELLPVALRPRPPPPRYARVNSLVGSMEATLASLHSMGFDLIQAPPFTSATSFYVDPHVPSLLVFPPSTAFHANPLYQSSAIILQDKASCFPSQCLNPSPDDVVVDGCAAPGNKTSHLLALMKEKEGGRRIHHGTSTPTSGGRVHAFEVEYRRCSTLCEMMREKGAEVKLECTRPTCHAELKGEQGKVVASPGPRVTVHHASFLALDWASELGRRVTHLLLDPTCSGSGMVHSIEAYYKEKVREEAKKEKATLRSERKKLKQKGQWTADTAPSVKRKRAAAGEEGEKEGEGEEDEEALAVESPSPLNPSLSSLASFQVSLLLHAFTLPSLVRVVYSTCSLHAEENEEVIASALQQRGRALGWSIEGGLLPTWPHRGLPTPSLTEEEVARMIRCDPDRDLTNGFFVCGLRRTAREDTAGEGETAGKGGGEEETGKEEGRGREEATDGAALPAKKRRKKRKRKKTVAAAVAVTVTGSGTGAPAVVESSR